MLRAAPEKVYRVLEIRTSHESDAANAKDRYQSFGSMRTPENERTDPSGLRLGR